MITRREFTAAAGLAALGAGSLGGYATAVEPGMRLTVKRYRITPPRWPEGLSLRIVALADIHACEPWMSAARIRGIVDRANRLAPDVTLLLGDYEAGMAIRMGDVPAADWAGALGGLLARRGVFAVLGNHDWGRGRAAGFAGDDRSDAWRALEAAGVPVLENDARPIRHQGRTIWIAGLGDQIVRRRGAVRRGRDDLGRTLAALGPADEPAILMAHEPDVFRRTPRRFALTLSGHTHGGQVRILGHAPMAKAKARYLYGHVNEYGRHLVVSGGLGCSVAPVRFGAPPEIVVVDMGPERARA